MARTTAQIVREYFPDADEDEIDNILWNYTGFPTFFDGSGTVEEQLREQLQHLKDVGFEQVEAEQENAMSYLASVAQRTELTVPIGQAVRSNRTGGTSA
jgi:hypothetical protein